MRELTSVTGDESWVQSERKRNRHADESFFDDSDLININGNL
jgi:hypothetical protein